MADFIFDINTIVQGNHGNKLPITIRNAGSTEGATVRVAIKRGAEVFTKQAVIIDATTGKFEVTLSASDLPTSGLYFYQPTITYADGREFTGEVGRFTVGGKLSGQPPVTIPVGIDLNRLGISANNRLTIDGVEQIGGTGGSVPSNVILFEDWVGGEPVTIDTSTAPPADTTAPVLTISPNGGNFASTQGVTMTTNETADIYYTLDGSTPTTASPKYTAALSLSATTTLKAFARDTAGNSSAVQTVTFTKDVTAPADTTSPVVTASPAAGTYTSAQSVTLSANETATIYYTTNGTTPTTASNVYSAPISISATTTLQFMAKDTAGNQSVPVAATYTINIPQADTTAPVLTMTAAATFTDSQTVNMSANETADIWYTVDGSDPVASGTRVKYSAPVTLTATTTIKAYAVDTTGNASVVQMVTYTKQAVGSFSTITDTFNRGDSLDLDATETGQTWVQHTDVKYGIRGNKAYQSQQVSGGVPRYRKIPTVTVPSNSFAVEITFATLDTVNANESVHIRWISATSTVMVYKNSGKYNIAKFGASGFLNLKAGTKTASNGDRLRIEHKSDGTINLYVNGILDATAIDTEFLSTSHKVGFGTDTQVSEFDDFRIEPIT